MKKIKISMHKLILLLSAIAILLLTVSALVMYKSLVPKTENPGLNISIPYDKISPLDIEYITFENPFYTNLKVDKNKAKGDLDHLAIVEVKYEVYNKEGINDELVAKLKDKEMVARSIILGIIRKESVEDMNRAKQKEVLGNKILDELQKKFMTNAIVKVYVQSIVTD